MKLKSIKFITLVLTSILGFSTLIAIPSYADGSSICDNAQVSDEVKAAAGCSGSGVSVNTLPEVVENILIAIIAVTGLVCAAFIVIGGINYVTSSGEPAKTKKAKDTILYAVIGLIVCALAFAAVNFVISNILNQQ